MKNVKDYEFKAITDSSEVKKAFRMVGIHNVGENHVFPFVWFPDLKNDLKPFLHNSQKYVYFDDIKKYLTEKRIGKLYEVIKKCRNNQTIKIKSKDAELREMLRNSVMFILNAMTVGEKIDFIHLRQSVRFKGPPNKKIEAFESILYDLDKEKIIDLEKSMLLKHHWG